MSSTTSTAPAHDFERLLGEASNSRRVSVKAWRVVETQHRASTLRLVDTLAEQAALEYLLEASKPPLPDEAGHLHWLLATPFRYPAPRPNGSRFRAVGDPGVWYGADAIRSALAEIGYWRLRFLADSPAMPDLPAVPHTVFRAAIGGRGVVLYQPPFDRESARWEDPASYAATQAFAAAARAARIEVIRYRSVRDPRHGACVAVLDPRVFRKPAPLEQHIWLVKASRLGVLAQASLTDERFAFSAADLDLAVPR
jgi:hypothetical protein